MMEKQYFLPKTRLVTGMSLALFAAACLTGLTVHAAENKKMVPAPEHAADIEKLNKEEQIAFARKDLATRLEIELDTVSFSGMTPVKWRSGALGCPKPEMTYPQVLVPGELMMLRVGNTAYRYHSLPSGTPFYCPEDRAEFPYTDASDT